MISEIVFLSILILFNGVLSMYEIAVVSSRKSRLEKLANRGDKGAKQALVFANSPNKFLSTVQVGITVVGILTGVFSGAHLSDNVTNFFLQIPLFAPYSNSIGIGAVVVLITYFSLVFGELVPKRIGMNRPEWVAIALSIPIRVLSIITSPFVWLLTNSTETIVKILGLSKAGDTKITEEEIKAIISESTRDGEIQEIEQDIVEQVFHMGDRKITSLMSHKSEIIWLDLDKSFDENRYLILENIHSVYPICSGELDAIVGVVYIKDLFKAILENKTIHLKDFVKAPIYIPENNSVYRVLETFKEKSVHAGIIVDEYGTVKGLVTINDILFELVSNVAETAPHDELITVREDGSWLVDGFMLYTDFIDHFEIEDDELKSNAQFNTLAGLIIHINDDIPKTGDCFTYKNYSLEIVDMDGKRVDKILLVKLDEKLDEKS